MENASRTDGTATRGIVTAVVLCWSGVAVAWTLAMPLKIALRGFPFGATMSDVTGVARRRRPIVPRGSQA